MDRSLTTKLLTNLVIADISDKPYYAKEVTLDWGTKNVKRVDVMHFSPAGVIHVSDIEKGIFTCYEIKSCLQDLYSGHGLNFFGEKNYIVMTMQLYKEMQKDIGSGYLDDYIRQNFPESSLHYGIKVPVPDYIDLRNSNYLYEEFRNPSKFEGKRSWKLYTMIPCRAGRRKRSAIELLFCMLRSKEKN